MTAHVKASLATPEAALTAARDGLQQLHSTFEFFRDGKSMPIKDAMTAFSGKCETGIIDGNKKAERRNFELPYNGKILRGEEIVRTHRAICVSVRVVDEWRRAGAAVQQVGESWCDGRA